MKRKNVIKLTKLLKTIIIPIEAIIVIILMVVAIFGDYNIAKIEQDYKETTQLVMLEDRLSVKEQARIDMAKLELPEEDYEENTTEEENEKKSDVERALVERYYNPTEEEEKWARFMAKAEAGTEDSFGQTLVINVAINRAIERGVSLVDVFTEEGQFSSVHNGIPCLRIIHEDGTIEWIPVTEEMITDEIKSAVDAAFEKDYTEELLKEEAISKGLEPSYYEGGALYFYNPNGHVSQEQLDYRAKIKVSFQYKNHIFYRVWDV